MVHIAQGERLLGMWVWIFTFLLERELILESLETGVLVDLRPRNSPSPSTTRPELGSFFQALLHLLRFWPSLVASILIAYSLYHLHHCAHWNCNLPSPSLNHASLPVCIWFMRYACYTHHRSPALSPLEERTLVRGSLELERLEDKDIFRSLHGHGVSWRGLEGRPSSERRCVASADMVAATFMLPRRNGETSIAGHWLHMIKWVPSRELSSNGPLVASLEDAPSQPGGRPRCAEATWGRHHQGERWEKPQGSLAALQAWAMQGLSR